MFRRQIMHTAHYVRPGHTPPARQGGQGQLYKWRELRVVGAVGDGSGVSRYTWLHLAISTSRVGSAIGL